MHFTILDFTEQLNRLAEAFHKYEIDEVRTGEGPSWGLLRDCENLAD